MTARKHGCLAAIGLVTGMLIAAPAGAQSTPEDAESLISASLNVDAGLALTRRQAAQNDLLGAAATAERVLIANPEAVAPRLLYASLLCRLDDRKGAGAELALLGREAVPDDGWVEVTNACGAMPRPGIGETGR